MEIYSPIAQRLGISKIKVELDDLSLKFLQPEVYHDLERQLKLGKEAREKFVKDIVAEVKQHIDNAGIPCEIDGRVKHFFSIYKKMVNQDKTLDQIYDLFAVRIIVDTVKDCYAALGVIHEMYKPIPGRFWRSSPVRRNSSSRRLKKAPRSLRNRLPAFPHIFRIRSSAAKTPFIFMKRSVFRLN